MPEAGFTNLNSDHILDGTFLAYDVYNTGRSLENGEWLAAGMYGVAGGVDLVATVSDPFGSLIAAGLGWLMDHFEPLKGWLDDLAGDPAAVEARGEEMAGISEQLATIVEELQSSVGALAHESGVAIESYRAFHHTMTGILEALREAVGSAGRAISIAASVVEAVRSMVRDAIAQIVGSLISYAAELVCTLGAATPWIIEQCSSRVASLAAHISTSIHSMVSSLRALNDLVSQLEGALRTMAGKMRGYHGTHRGMPAAPDLPDKGLTTRLKDIDYGGIVTGETAATDGGLAHKNAERRRVGAE